MDDPFSIKISRKKTIFHMDGDAFFVGVEAAKNPRLRGLPVVTGEERGIVSALSYEAKALGVVRGLPIFRLKKDFPTVIVLPGDYASYARYSRMMFDIVRRYADDVEEYSIDECFADLTGLDRPLKMTYREMAERIKKEIYDELDVSVSVGIAPTKVLAKVASKWVKPNGLTVIDPPAIGDFLAQIPIEKIWGIGRQTSEALRKRGVNTALDFSKKELSWLQNNFSKPYLAIWQELNGLSVMDIDPEPKTVYSSIQRTRSFHPNSNDRLFLISQLSKHIEDACAKARHFCFAPKKVSFFLKTKDFMYSNCTVPLSSPTNAPEIIISLAVKEFGKIYDRRLLYRTAGVTLHELVPTSVHQIDLFGENKRAERFEAVHRQIDLLEDKFGRHTVYVASTHQALEREEKGTDVEDVDLSLVFL